MVDLDGLRALSLSRPWTTLILNGTKDVENRSWRTPYRGTLVIHGAQSWDGDSAAATAGQILDPDSYPLTDLFINGKHPTGYLGTVELVECHEPGTTACVTAINRWQPFGSPPIGRCSPWAFDYACHWVLAYPRRFPEPIPGNGRLSLFRPPPEVLAAVEAFG